MAMKVIIGLGNPGAAYARTRHNAGFWVVEAAAHAWGWPLTQQVRSGGREVVRYAQGRLEGADDAVRLVEPLTFMNASGVVVGPLVRRAGVALEDLLVVCDDVHLPTGTLRVRGDGSSGGHHGLASIIDALGTARIPRLRVGVGREPVSQALADYVLARVPAEEWNVLQASLPRAVAVCRTWLTDGVEAAMQQCNRRVGTTRGASAG